MPTMIETKANGYQVGWLERDPGMIVAKSLTDAMRTAAELVDAHFSGQIANTSQLSVTLQGVVIYCHLSISDFKRCFSGSEVTISQLGSSSQVVRLKVQRHGIVWCADSFSMSDLNHSTVIL